MANPKDYRPSMAQQEARAADLMTTPKVTKPTAAQRLQSFIRLLAELSREGLTEQYLIAVDAAAGEEGDSLEYYRRLLCLIEAVAKARFPSWETP